MTLPCSTVLLLLFAIVSMATESIFQVFLGGGRFPRKLNQENPSYSVSTLHTHVYNIFFHRWGRKIRFGTILGEDLGSDFL